ncbi:hypothetical protein GGU11DRAFT_759104 [Lentinula aff. detonsa]|nr:hypothetical protein GGU11DRAFT_759104 [Lentinula aff. detonsa]
MSINSLLNALAVSNLLNPAPANCSSDVYSGYSLAPARQLIHRDYKLNSKTTLSVVYLYPPGSVVEYPETGQLDDQSGWAKPSLDFLYSHGEPRGYSRGNFYHWLRGSLHLKILNLIRYKAKGSKYALFLTPLKEKQQQHQDTISPASEVFEWTTALLAALIRVGCTSRTATELELWSMKLIASRCDEGFLMQPIDAQEILFLVSALKIHLLYSANVIPELIETIFLMVLLAMAATMLVIFKRYLRGIWRRLSSQQITCGAIHCNQQTGCLKQMKFAEQSCTCKFHGYKPKPEYHHECPYILVVSKGPHTHLVPLLEKTPASVKIELESLLQKLEVDLADITLHLKVYIQRIKGTCFPWGTGWNGLKRLKTQQDKLLAPDNQYIRLIIEIPSTSLGPPEEDDIPEDDGPLQQDELLRIVICMTSYASNKLVKAQYLQSNIAFKCIVGFYEFEITSVDHYANTIILSWSHDMSIFATTGKKQYTHFWLQINEEEPAEIA